MIRQSPHPGFDELIIRWGKKECLFQSGSSLPWTLWFSSALLSVGSRQMGHFLNAELIQWLQGVHGLCTYNFSTFTLEGTATCWLSYSCFVIRVPDCYCTTRYILAFRDAFRSHCKYKHTVHSMTSVKSWSCHLYPKSRAVALGRFDQWVPNLAVHWFTWVALEKYNFQDSTPSPFEFFVARNHYN